MAVPSPSSPRPPSPLNNEAKSEEEYDGRGCSSLVDNSECGDEHGILCASPSAPASASVSTPAQTCVVPSNDVTPHEKSGGISNEGASDRLSSLLQFLSEAEGGSPLKVESPSQNLDSAADETCSSHNDTCPDERKTWIWDQWDQDHSFSEEKCGDSNDVTDSTTESTDLTIVCERIKEKVSALRAELSARTKEADVLQKCLVRGRVMHKRKMDKINLAWNERFEKQTLDHKKVMDEQRTFIEKLNQDCSKLSQKRERLENDMKLIRASRDDLCKRLEVEGKRDLEKAQKEWKSLEKSRLASLAKEKTAEIKKEAAKALEPEVARLMSENKAELARLRTKLQTELAEFRDTIRRQQEAQYNDETSKVHLSCEERTTDLRKEHEQKLIYAASQHAEELDKLQKTFGKESKEDHARFQEEVREKTAEYSKEIELATQRSDDDFRKALESHQDEMKKVDEKHKDALEAERREQDIATERWKGKKADELRKKSRIAEQEELASMEKKMKEEVDMVSEKLQKSYSEQMLECKKKIEQEAVDLEESHQAEIQELVAQQEHADRAFLASQKEEKGAREELKKLKDAIDARRSKLEKLERQSTEERDKLRDVETSCEEQIVSARENAEQKISEAKARVKALEVAIKTAESDEPRLREERKKEKGELEARHAAELTSVNRKIAKMIDRKKKMVKDASALLRSKKEEIAKHEKDLDEARRRRVLRERNE